jgi:hypothetical protein
MFALWILSLPLAADRAGHGHFVRYSGERLKALNEDMKQMLN